MSGDNSSIPSNATELTFSVESRILASVATMILLFVLSSIGNLTVFVSLITSPLRKTRISRILLHLTIADLIVTFIIIPSEVIWRISRFWLAGNVACKVFAFLRAFGFYLSSMVLVVVSIDRYLAVVYPLKANSGLFCQCSLMLLGAWMVAALFSFPQVFFWSAEEVKGNESYKQCVTFNSDTKAVKAFTSFFLISVYFIPLVIMIYAYSHILATIFKKSSNSPLLAANPGNAQGQQNSTQIPSSCCIHLEKRRKGDSPLTFRNRLNIPHNHQSHCGRVHFNKAKSRTLRMTLSIVMVFICCWTPYVSLSLWYVIDEKSFLKFDARIADVMFILTMCNSVANPYVYGSYASEMRSKFLKWFGVWCRLFKSKQNYSTSPLARKSFLQVVDKDDKKAEGNNGLSECAQRLTRSDMYVEINPKSKIISVSTASMCPAKKRLAKKEALYGKFLQTHSLINVFLSDDAERSILSHTNRRYRGGSKEEDFDLLVNSPMNSLHPRRIQGSRSVDNLQLSKVYKDDAYTF